MVMIVKLNRSRAATPEVAPTVDEAGTQRDAAPRLDVLVAPAVLQHRYVRGVDKSLIVERPERIRAVLLGIAAAIGKDTDQHPPLPTASGIHTNDDDDLVAKLGSLSVKADVGSAQRYRVLHSTRSISLHPAHPAVAFTHAHAEDQVTMLESAYQLARQRRKNERIQLDALPNPALPAAPKDDGSSTPKPQPAPEPELVLASHAAYLDHLCNNAPNQPPVSHAQKLARPHPPHEDSENYTSPDGEGDEAMHLSEVPPHLPQGDLYLAGPGSDADGGSAEAIRHAMGACCEAVDRVVAATTSATCSTLQEIRHDPAAATGTEAPAKRVFVLSRPPGHHCAGSTPSGFCWVNNAVVASAHAYLTHSIDRVVVLDIDLHHGNGTQTLAWRINADANKHDDARFERISSLRHAALDRLRTTHRRGARVAISEQEDANIKDQAGKRALRMFYGSIHDIESYPCEDGDAALVRDASTCVEGAHGQWIWNKQDFAHVYETKYSALFAKAARFLTATKAAPERTLVLISAGFDACAYEYPGMQRHGKSVPPSFYHRFARDTVAFANQWSQGKVVSVLEGGYSDRALCSAAMAHVTGLANTSKDNEAEHEYWKLENLIALEKMAKKMAANAAAAAADTSTNTTPKKRQAELAPWLAVSSKAFAAFEQACGKQYVVPVGMSVSGSGRETAADASTFNSPAAGRVLRDRKFKTGVDTPLEATPVAARKTGTPGTASNSPSKKRTVRKDHPVLPDKTSPTEPAAAEQPRAGVVAKEEPPPPSPAEPTSNDSPLVWTPSDMQSPSNSAPSDSMQNMSISPGAVSRDVQSSSSSNFDPSQERSLSSPPAPIRFERPTSPTEMEESRVGSQTPTDRGLTATSVTLVDAMSNVHIVDRNTANLDNNGGQFGNSMGSKLMDSDDAASYSVFDDDAPGSPDPRFAGMPNPFTSPPVSAGTGPSHGLGFGSQPSDSSPSPPKPSNADPAFSPSQRQHEQNAQSRLYPTLPLSIPPMRFTNHGPPPPKS